MTNPATGDAAGICGDVIYGAAATARTSLLRAEYPSGKESA
jgi:hypothetical protein